MIQCFSPMLANPIDASHQPIEIAAHQDERDFKTLDCYKSTMCFQAMSEFSVVLKTSPRFCCFLCEGLEVERCLTMIGTRTCGGEGVTCSFKANDFNHFCPSLLFQRPLSASSYSSPQAQ